MSRGGARPNSGPKAPDDKRIVGAIEKAKTIIDALYYTHARAK